MQMATASSNQMGRVGWQMSETLTTSSRAKTASCSRLGLQTCLVVNSRAMSLLPVLNAGSERTLGLHLTRTNHCTSTLRRPRRISP